jgi:hypothetical protein
VTHWIHPDAETELGDAAVYYATHASLAIAEAFLAEYERVRDLIVENERPLAAEYQHYHERIWPDALPQSALMEGWWHHMADIMVVQADQEPVQSMLVPTFHMD